MFLVTREGFSSGAVSRADAKLIFVNQSSSTRTTRRLTPATSRFHPAVNTRPNWTLPATGRTRRFRGRGSRGLAPSTSYRLCFEARSISDPRRVYDGSKRGGAVSMTLTRARGPDGVRALMGVLRRSTGRSDFAH